LRGRGEKKRVEDHDPRHRPRRNGTPLRAPTERDDVAGQAHPDQSEQRQQAQIDAHAAVDDAYRDQLAHRRRPAQLHEPRQVDPVAVRRFECFGAVHRWIDIARKALQYSVGIILAGRHDRCKRASPMFRDP
jgi:hypothetical protein